MKYAKNLLFVTNVLTSILLDNAIQTNKDTNGPETMSTTLSLMLLVKTTQPSMPIIDVLDTYANVTESLPPVSLCSTGIGILPTTPDGVTSTDWLVAFQELVITDKMPVAVVTVLPKTNGVNPTSLCDDHMPLPTQLLPAVTTSSTTTFLTKNAAWTLTAIS
jgi:hypothetical protein